MTMNARFPDRLPDDVTLGSDLDLEDEEVTTSSGRRLTEQYADELAERLTSGPGRPSLTGAGERSPSLNLKISADTKTRLVELARQQGRRQSDVVRAAIDEYLGRHTA